MARSPFLFLLFYAFAIAYLSLYPFAFSTPRPGGLGWATDGSARRLILDGVLNLFLYAPFGASLALALNPLLRPRWTIWVVAALAGLTLSVSEEKQQLWIPARNPNLRDVVANATGAALGAVLSFVVPPLVRTLDASGSRSRMRGPTALLFTVWILWHAFPMMPAFSLNAIRNAVGQIRDLSLPPLEMLPVLAGFWVLATAVRSPLWLALALLVFPLQAVLQEHQFMPAYIIAALAGWALALAAGKLGDSRHALLAAFLLGLLIFEEFRPFQFLPQPVPFAWRPFDTWFEAPSARYYGIIFRKLFLYLSLLWALRRWRPSWTLATLVPAAIVASGEWLQRYLVGRTPESTDMVLILISAILLWLSGRPALAQRHAQSRSEQHPGPFSEIR